MVWILRVFFNLSDSIYTKLPKIDKESPLLTDDHDFYLLQTDPTFKMI